MSYKHAHCTYGLYNLVPRPHDLFQKIEKDWGAWVRGYLWPIENAHLLYSKMALERMATPTDILTARGLLAKLKHLQF